MYLGYNTPKHWKNPVNNEVVFKGISAYQVFVYRCFLKWWYPQNTPKWSSLVGKPVVVGYHHFRKPPYTHKNLGYPWNVPLLWGCFCTLHPAAKLVKIPIKTNGHTVDGFRNPASTSWGKGSFFPIIYRVFTNIPGGCLGFCPENSSILVFSLCRYAKTQCVNKFWCSYV